MIHSKSLFIGILSLAVGSVCLASDGLYSVGAQDEDTPLPLQWMVGAQLIYDDNVAPNGLGTDEDSMAFSPFVGAKWTSVTPRTIIDLYANISTMYYFDAPSTVDDATINTRLNFNVTHDVSERITLTSRNFVAYELEPNYAYGYASSRQNGEHLFWSTNQGFDYNWTRRFTTRHSVGFSGTDYQDDNNLNREVFTLANSMRYRLSPQTVLTAQHRYTDSTGGGLSSDSSNHFFTVGAEHRFSPNTIGRIDTGVQLRDVENGNSSTAPYLDMSLNTRVNRQLRVSSFLRYSMEDFDTIQGIGLAAAEFDSRKTLRFGARSDYTLSPKVTIFGGVDYIMTSFEDGRSIVFATPVPNADEDVINAYIGFALRITQNLEANASFNHTTADSDFGGRDYDRNRISLGVNAYF